MSQNRNKQSQQFVFWSTMCAAGAVVLGLAGACQRPSSGPGLADLVHIHLTDFPLADAEVTRVWVTFTTIEVHSETTGWMTVVDYGAVGRTFNLLALRNGTTEELGAFELAPGIYDQIRLHIRGDNLIEVDDGSGPRTEPLTIPSGEQTGIKLVRSFTVPDVGATSIVVDFDAQKSVLHSPGSGYKLKPTIKIVEVSTREGTERLISAADGGAVRILGEATLDIPPGALDQDTFIGMRVITLDSAITKSAGLLPGSVVDLSPPGLVFNVPATITLHYDPAEIPGNAAESSLLILHAEHSDPLTSTDPWEERPSTVDAALRTVSGTLKHFSHAGVGPPAVKVTVTPPTLVIDKHSTGVLTGTPVDGNGTPFGHGVQWFSNNLGIASVSDGTVFGNNRGTALITAVVANSPPDINASGTATVIVKSRFRRVSAGGSVFVLDDDFLDDDESGTFGIGGLCSVDPSNRFSTFFTGGNGTCVDDEAKIDITVECRLLGDDETVQVKVIGKLFESDSCPNSDEDGSGEQTLNLAPDQTGTFTFRVDNTDEGGDFADINLSVTNGEQ
jgi:hypothetical protein